MTKLDEKKISGQHRSICFRYALVNFQAATLSSNAGVLATEVTGASVGPQFRGGTGSHIFESIAPAIAKQTWRPVSDDVRSFLTAPPRLQTYSENLGLTPASSIYWGEHSVSRSLRGFRLLSSHWPIGTSALAGGFKETNSLGERREQDVFVFRYSNSDGNLDCRRICKRQAERNFLKKAIGGNFAEVSMGDLAQRMAKATTTSSRMAKLLFADHDGANQKAMDAAKGLGVSPSTGPNAKQKADYDKMSKMSGAAALDKMFATHMIAAHKKDIAEYKQAKKNKDAAGEYAAGQIETLQKHLDAAKSLKPGR